MGWHAAIAQAVLFSHRVVLTCLGVTEAWNSSYDFKQGGNDYNLLQGSTAAFAQRVWGKPRIFCQVNLGSSRHMIRAPPGYKSEVLALYGLCVCVYLQAVCMYVCMLIYNIKVKSSLCFINYAPRHADVWRSGDIAPPVLTLTPSVGEWSASRQARFGPKGRAPYPLGGRLGGPHSRPGRRGEEKIILSLPGP
jgi:hypothetical protein